jgi:BirA family biotin operon repressor/biotin-[acetyl-CoA-carboxylase] ligase
MTQPREVWRLDTKRLGRRVLVFDQLPSTNDLAARLSRDPGADGLVILADAQTAGRGQHGRTWTAASQSSVLLSVIVSPPEHLRRPAVLTAWAAVSVCRTVHRTIGLPARIKWPNDVLVRGKKVSGILLEQGHATVVGIGLNVRQTADEFAAARLPQAASLAQFTQAMLDPKNVARDLVHVLDAEFSALLDGDLATLEACWTWHLGLLGREVVVECRDGVVHGRLHDLTFAGLSFVRDGQPPLLLPPERVLHVERRVRA